MSEKPLRDGSLWVPLMKPTWRWQYCSQSGWSFQIGRPHLATRSVRNHFGSGTGHIDRTIVQGEMTIHVFHTRWRIEGADFVDCDEMSEPAVIDRTMARMDGLLIRNLALHQDGWVASMWFDAGIQITCTPYEDSTPDGIANLLTNDPESPDS